MQVDYHKQVLKQQPVVLLENVGLASTFGIEIFQAGCSDINQSLF
jgi:hypothetical protein